MLEAASCGDAKPIAFASKLAAPLATSTMKRSLTGATTPGSTPTPPPEKSAVGPTANTMPLLSGKMNGHAG